MESWRKVWREGISPSFTLKNLLVLKEGLEKDDICIMQGGTTSPPPLLSCKEYPIEAACPIGYTGWKSEGLANVSEVEEFFARICYEADKKLGEPAAIRYFLNWIDDTPRGEVFKELLSEVNMAIDKRNQDNNQ